MNVLYEKSYKLYSLIGLIGLILINAFFYDFYFGKFAVLSSSLLRFDDLISILSETYDESFSLFVFSLILVLFHVFLNLTFILLIMASFLGKIIIFFGSEHSILKINKRILRTNEWFEINSKSEVYLYKFNEPDFGSKYSLFVKQDHEFRESTIEPKLIAKYVHDYLKINVVQTNVDPRNG